MDKKFITLNVRRFYTAGSLITVASALAKYNSHQVAVQEVRRDMFGSHRAGDFICCYGNGNCICQR